MIGLSAVPLLRISLIVGVVFLLALASRSWGEPSLTVELDIGMNLSLAGWGAAPCLFLPLFLGRLMRAWALRLPPASFWLAGLTRGWVFLLPAFMLGVVPAWTFLYSLLDSSQWLGYDLWLPHLLLLGFVMGFAGSAVGSRDFRQVFVTMNSLEVMLQRFGWYRNSVVAKVILTEIVLLWIVFLFDFWGADLAMVELTTGQTFWMFGALLCGATVLGHLVGDRTMGLRGVFKNRALMGQTS